MLNTLETERSNAQLQAELRKLRAEVNSTKWQAFTFCAMLFIFALSILSLEFHWLKVAIHAACFH
jgi:hypothetical protein